MKTMDPDFVRQFGHIHFEPKEDITPYELAKCMQVVVGVERFNNVQDIKKWLPKGCHRHFVMHESSYTDEFYK